MAKFIVDGEEVEITGEAEYLKDKKLIHVQVRVKQEMYDDAAKAMVTLYDNTLNTMVTNLNDFSDLWLSVAGEAKTTPAELFNKGAVTLKDSMLDRDGILMLDAKDGSYKRVVFQKNGTCVETALTAEDKKFIKSLKGKPAPTPSGTMQINNIEIKYDTTKNDLVVDIYSVYPDGSAGLKETKEGKDAVNDALKELYALTHAMDIFSLMTPSTRGGITRVKFTPAEVKDYYDLKEKKYLDKESAKHPKNVVPVSSTDSIEHVQIFLDSDNKLKAKYDVISATGTVTPQTIEGMNNVNDLLDKLYKRYKVKGLLMLCARNKIKMDSALIGLYNLDGDNAHFISEKDYHPAKAKESGTKGKTPRKNILKTAIEKWKNLSKGKRRLIKISSLVVLLATLAACIGSCSKNSSSNENIFENNGKSDGNIEDTEIDFGDGLGLNSSDEDVVNALRNEEYKAEDCKFDIERTNEYTDPDQFLSFRDQVDYYISEKEHCNFEDMVDIDDAPTIREITKALESTYNDPSKEVQFGQWITGYLCDGITKLNGVKIKPYKGGYSTSIDRYIAVGIGAYYRTNGIITDPRVDEEVIRFDAGFEETMKGYH